MALGLCWKMAYAISRLAEHAMSVGHNLGKRERENSERSSKVVCQRIIAPDDCDSAQEAAKGSVTDISHRCWNT